MPLPFPVRIAAGLVATAVEQARDLPRLVIEFPVTAVSQALQASMRMQQRVTELAIKGDRALGVLRPVEEKPSWATFDEEEPRPRNGVSTVTELRPSGRSAPAPNSAAEPAETMTVLTETPGFDPPVAEIVIPKSARAAVPVDEPFLADDLPSEPILTADDVRSLDEALTSDLADPQAAADDERPPAMPDYAAMSIPQLRGKLRFLSVEDLRTLLEWETAHGDRPPFVTMLTNRITTVLEA